MSRWRRWRIVTTATEMPARTTIAIRIGTSGEEPPPPEEDDAVLGTGVAACTPAFAEGPLPLSGLPFPLPPSLLVVAPAPSEPEGTSSVYEPSTDPVESAPAAAPAGASAPPLPPDESDELPSAVGSPGLYSTPLLELSA